MTVWLCNRRNKTEALKALEAEKFTRKTISFYRYVPLNNLTTLRRELFLAWDQWHCLGRVYLAEEGINAQMSIPEPHWESFVEYLNTVSAFANMTFREAVEESTSFWKLTIKIRQKLVADGLSDQAIDLSQIGEHLSAEKWNNLLSDPSSICVDMRNAYESEIGKFEKAYCPPSLTFKDSLPMVREKLKGKESQPIMLYCTGGIRCEKASAYLRRHGFEQVKQLKGGIIDYAHQVKEKGLTNKFRGKNFVFDHRTAEKISDEVIAHCHQCEAVCDTHTNCRNLSCNRLFIQCPQCQKKYDGCCSTECQGIIQLPAEKYRQYRQAQGPKVAGKLNIGYQKISSK